MEIEKKGYPELLVRRIVERNMEEFIADVFTVAIMTDVCRKILCGVLGCCIITLRYWRTPIWSS